jgi:asparagine synthase (glutamine-hydrolysing)
LAAKDQASWMELNLYMQNQLLRDADVMSMAHSIEIRLPFLDQGLIRFMLSLDPKKKYAGPFQKQLLINAFKDILPNEVWNRKKMGFSFPFTQWMNQSDFIKDSFSQGSINSKKYYQKFKEGNLQWSHLLSLLMIEKKAHA